MPQDRSINALATNQGLIVRYPVRMKEDLLPYTKITTSELRQLLAREIERHGCPNADVLASRIAAEQLELEGTFILHSKTAAKNGGDYDFDYVCVVEGDRFPRFVEQRFRYQGNRGIEKTKTRKARSPWWNLPQVKEFLGYRRLDQITVGDLENFKTWRRENDIKEVTICHDLLALSQLFQLGQRHGWCPTNPVRDLKLPLDEASRNETVLSDEEDKKYFEAAARHQNLFDVGRLMILQGLRPEEVMSLQAPRLRNAGSLTG